MPINYSKWDNLELSDDEDNFHPNIDNNLMIRLQREKRQQREVDEEEKKKNLIEVGARALQPPRAARSRLLLTSGGRSASGSLGQAACGVSLRAASRSRAPPGRRRALPRRWRRLPRSRGWRSCT